MFSSLLTAGLLLSAIGHWRLLEYQTLAAGARWWAAGLVALWAAAWAGDRGTPLPRERAWSGADTAAMLSVIALAVLTRLWRVTEYPPVDAFAFEEFQTGGMAYQVLREGALPLEFPLTNILPALSFGAFGMSSFALRAPFLLSGIAAPLLLFLGLRRLVSLPAAWAAAALLASSRWPAAAARFADEIFFPISIVALSFWLLVRAVQRERQTSAVALALVSGDLFYAYSGYRPFPVIAWTSAVLLAWRGARRGALPPRLGGCLAILTAVWFAMLGPGVVSTVAQRNEVFLEPFARHAAVRQWLTPDARSLAGRFREAASNAAHGAAAFVTEGDPIASVNIPGDPMVDRVTAAVLFLALLGAVWRWRDPWRATTLAAVLMPFGAMAVIVTNVNVSRYFVLLVPLFALVGFLVDDLGRMGVPRAWVRGAALLLVAVVAALNLRDLQRLIDDPMVRESFAVPENTVLAAIHAAPAGARAVLLTKEGSNAFEPSDYRWYTTHLTGARPESLAEAFAVSAQETRPVVWVTQGAAEADLLPRLVALICPGATRQIRPAPNPAAVVGVVSVPSGAGCRPPPPLGLRAVYAIDADGGPHEIERTDLALMANTIPWRLGWQLEDRQISGLRVRWSGSVVPESAGAYAFRLELANATGTLRVGTASTAVAQPGDFWQGAGLFVEMGAEAVSIAVELRAPAGAAPSVRLFWRPPGGQEELVPPTALRPDAAQE